VVGSNAARYAKRGSAYSEKARSLDPASAEAYYSRGQTYYDRAVLEVVPTRRPRKPWFDPATADF
jgi:hypothetical protein